jgi:hypothetical protein
MIAAILTEAASAVIASGEGGAPAWLLLFGPAGAVAFYGGMWSYYRNTGQSHQFERETRIESKPVTGGETKVNEITGTRSASIDGDNRSDHRERVQRID